MSEIITIGKSTERAHITNDEMTLGDYLNLTLVKAEHQRTASAWKNKEKQELILTAIAGLGVPNFFVRIKNTPTSTRTTIEDGLQRTSAFMNFMKGNLVLPRNTILQMPEGWVDPEAPELDEDMEIIGTNGDLEEGQYDASGKRYDELPEIVREQFLSMPVLVSYMHNFTDAQTRNFFKVLQQGTPLNQTEKRNATNRALSKLVTGLTANNKEFFQMTGTQLTRAQINRGTPDRMKDKEQALSIMTIVTAEDNMGITASAKNSLSTRGYTRDSGAYKLTDATLGAMSSIMENMDEDARKMVKPTVIPPLARVVSERISNEQSVDAVKMADFLEEFLTKVNDTTDTSNSDIVHYRAASAQGASSNAQMSRRVEILRKAIAEAV